MWAYSRGGHVNTSKTNNQRFKKWFFHAILYAHFNMSMHYILILSICEVYDVDKCSWWTSKYKRFNGYLPFTLKSVFPFLFTLLRDFFRKCGLYIVCIFQKRSCKWMARVVKQLLSIKPVPSKFIQTVQIEWHKPIYFFFSTMDVIWFFNL